MRAPAAGVRPEARVATATSGPSRARSRSPEARRSRIVEDAAGPSAGSCDTAPPLGPVLSADAEADGAGPAAVAVREHRAGVRHEGRRDPAVPHRRPPAGLGKGDPVRLAPGATRAAAAAVARCRPAALLPGAGRRPGETDVVLGSPIILYDYPEIAAESTGALFDSTEIDEILTLRVMTMTDEEKAEARATDPRAAEIIDRCDGMSAEDLQQLHGVLRDPRARRLPSAGARREVPAAETDASRGGTPPPTRVCGPSSTRPHRRGTCRPGQPGPGAPVTTCRRPGPFLRRPGGPGDRCALRRGRRHARRPRPRRRPGCGPARVVRPLPLLRAGRARATGSSTRGEPFMRTSDL